MSFYERFYVLGDSKSNLTLLKSCIFILTDIQINPMENMYWSYTFLLRIKPHWIE